MEYLSRKVRRKGIICPYLVFVQNIFWVFKAYRNEMMIPRDIIFWVETTKQKRSYLEYLAELFNGTSRRVFFSPWKLEVLSVCYGLATQRVSSYVSPKISKQIDSGYLQFWRIRTIVNLCNGKLRAMNHPQVITSLMIPL